MLQKLLLVFMMCSIELCYANEFVVSKKSKSKKEIAIHVKEDVVELCESVLRQVGKNIQQSVAVQNQVFDMIKMIAEDNSLTTAQLKEVRGKLEKYLKELEDQWAQSQLFLLQKS